MEQQRTTGIKSREKQKALENLLNKPAVGPAEVLFGTHSGEHVEAQFPSNLNTLQLSDPHVETFENENIYFEWALKKIEEEKKLEATRLEGKRNELQKILENRELRARYMNQKRKEEAEANRIYQLQQQMLDEDTKNALLIAQSEKENREKEDGGFEIKKTDTEQLELKEEIDAMLAKDANVGNPMKFEFATFIGKEEDQKQGLEHAEKEKRKK